jgi:hypothetical protein
LFKAVRREFVRLGGMELVPVRMKIPQVLKAEWIWEIVARDSGEEKESDANKGVQSITGTWLIVGDGREYGKRTCNASLI